MTLSSVAPLDSIDRVRVAVAVACRARLEDLHASTRPAEVMGWDSFGRLQVVLELERVLGCELPLQRAFAADSIADLASIVGESRP